MKQRSRLQALLLKALWVRCSCLSRRMLPAHLCSPAAANAAASRLAKEQQQQQQAVTQSTYKD
jgi:hypothetical protein